MHSVIMPAHNTEKVLLMSLESIWEQPPEGQRVVTHKANAYWV